MRLSPRRWAVLVLLGALVTGIGASAFACARLATFNMSRGSGQAGTTVTITGAGFAGPRRDADLPATPVVLRWHSDTGPVLAEATPDRYGSISATFTVPDARPGTYVILGIQRTPRLLPGAPEGQEPAYFAEPGTPARASFEVLGAGGVRVITQPAIQAATGAEGQGELDGAVWLVLTAAFGAVALSLFGGGLIAFVHQTRKAREPARARWIPPGW